MSYSENNPEINHSGYSGIICQILNNYIYKSITTSLYFFFLCVRPCLCVCGYVCVGVDVSVCGWVGRYVGVCACVCVKRV